MHKRNVFVKQVLILLIVILLLTSLSWWFLFSHTKQGVVDALFWGGAFSIVVGFLLRSGSKKGTYDLNYQHFRAYGESTMEDRRNLDSEDLARSSYDMWMLFAAGLIVIALSIFIDMIF